MKYETTHVVHSKRNLARVSREYKMLFLRVHASPQKLTHCHLASGKKITCGYNLTPGIYKLLSKLAELPVTAE